MKRTILAVIAATTISLLVPAASRPSVHAAVPVGHQPAPCQVGDTVHTIAPGVWSIEPRPGFSPLTATPVQLDCYGIGRRPVNPTAAANWDRRARNFHYVLPVIAQVSGVQPSGPRGSFATYNWTGYETIYGDNGGDYFRQVQAAYNVPTVPSGVGYTQNVSAWVGNGGDIYHNPTSTIIWQAGTDSITGQSASYYFFYENWGCTPGTSYCPNSGNPVLFSSPSVAAGQAVYVSVSSSAGTAYFQNTSTGQATNLTVSINNNNTGYSSEWITEEAGCPDACTVTTFTNPFFNEAYTYGSVSSGYFDTLGYQRIDLLDKQDNNKIVATPSVPDTLWHGYNEACCAF